MAKFTSLIAGITAGVVLGVIFTSFWDVPPATTTLSIIAISLGIILALTGLIIRRSKPKISENIRRKEFYGVATVIFGWTQLWIINLGGRIDQLYQILASMK